MKNLLLSSVVALCAMFISSAIVAQDAPQAGEKPEADTPARVLEATPERPFKVLIRRDDSVKPGEVSVTAGDEGTRILRVHPETPLEVVRQKLQELQGQNAPTPHTAAGNVMFRLNSETARPVNQAARPATIAAVRPPVDPDFVQLLQARLQHATRVLQSLQARHQSGIEGATDADISAAELAVKEAQFALKKATQPWPTMPPQPQILRAAKLTPAMTTRPAQPFPAQPFPVGPFPAGPFPAFTPMMPFFNPAMNPETAALRKAYIGQLAGQLKELQQKFVAMDVAFKSGEETDAVAWLRAKIVYLDAAARFYREAGVPDRLMESQRDRSKAVTMLVRLLEEKSKQENLGEEDRKELQKQLRNLRIIAAEATPDAPAMK